METPTLSDNEQYLLKKYDYIPISAELIEHVRRLDGFNVSALKISYLIQEEELIKLKSMMTQVARKMVSTNSL
jgi:hypothetical protein